MLLCINKYEVIVLVERLNAAIPLQGQRPHTHPSRHMDVETRRMERRSDLHSTRNRSLEGRRESLYYAPSAREGSIKTQRVMSYQKRVRVTKPCFSNCTIRGTGPSARPRRNAAVRILPPEIEDEPSGPPSAPCVSPELSVIVAVAVAGPSPV